MAKPTKPTKQQIDLAIGVVIGHILYEAMHDLDLMIIDDSLRWITIHPNGKQHKGRACKIDSETGQIKGGNLPHNFYNKPLKKAFEQADNSEDNHYFALQSTDLPKTQKGNARSSIKPQKLSLAELKAANIQGEQSLKANPLPRRFKDKYEGINYLKKLMPNTRYIIDDLPVNVIYSLAKGLYYFGHYFPFILVRGVDEINEYQLKVALYESQAKQRKQAIYEFNSNKELIDKIKFQSEQSVKLLNNSIIGLSENELIDVFDDFDFVYPIADANRKQDGSLKDDVYKNLLKFVFNYNSVKIRDKYLVEKGLIARAPKKIDNNVAATFNKSIISLNGLYYGYESERKIQRIYNSKAQDGWTFELSSDFNPHIAIFIHELAHAIDYQLAISHSKAVIVDYNNYVKEMRRKKVTSYAYLNIEEYVAQIISEAITAKSKTRKAKKLLLHSMDLCHRKSQKD